VTKPPHPVTWIVVGRRKVAHHVMFRAGPERELPSDIP